MNEPNLPSRPTLHWNRWGWFGGTLGPVVFLPLSAAALFPNHVLSAAVLIGLFVVCGGLSFTFWHRRSQQQLFRALAITLAVQFIAVMAGTFIIYHHDLRGPLSGTHVSPNVFFILPVVYAFVFFQLRAQNRRDANVA